MKVETVDVKSEDLNDDVDAARDRLKGALKVLVHPEGDDSESSADEPEPIRQRQPKSVPESPLRFKAKKRRIETSTGNAFHHTYVMKLFDRSVDLAQFEEDTPLYPICRAWMANQPRTPLPVIKRRLSSPEPEPTSNGDDNNTLSDVHKLPPPVMELVNRIPSPLPEQQIQTLNEVIETNSLYTRDELLQGHQARWVNVRRKWQDQARKYEDRYSESTAVLAAIYNKAQENMT